MTNELLVEALANSVAVFSKMEVDEIKEKLKKTDEKLPEIWTKIY